MVLYKDFRFVHYRLLNRRHGTKVTYMEMRGLVESLIMRSFLLSFTT